MESTLSKDISELLYHYDCVIVPALGGFVTNYRPARLDKDLHLFHPPSKEVSFNRQLDTNDGILAHAIAKAGSVTHEEANALIRAEVESYFSALDQGGRVVFNKVGILYLDREKNVQFSPDGTINYLLDSYGLKKVHAVPVEKVVEEKFPQPVIISAPPPIPRIETRPELTIVAPEPTPKKYEPVVEQVKEEVATIVGLDAVEADGRSSSQWYWVAALIPLLFIIGVLGYHNGLLKNGSMHMGELDPFNDTVTATYEARNGELSIVTEPMPTLSTDTTSDWFTTFIKGPAKKNVADITAVDAATDRSTALAKERGTVAEAVNTYVAPSKITHLEFHIIAGCFSIEDNAQKMVDRLRAAGFGSNILDKRKGLYRVTYGSYTNRSEALDDLTAVKRENDAAAWLLRKR